MIAAALLCTCLAAPPSDEAPVSGDCSADPASLVSEADALLSVSGPEPDAETLARARRLLRAARRLEVSPELFLRAADLAFAAGDAEEGEDLLAAAADAAPARLSPAELFLLGRRAEQRRRWREAINHYEQMASGLASLGETVSWIGPRVRELELEEQAESIALPSTGPSVEARLALADGKRALVAGRLRQAREHLRTALQLAPSYVEALLALAALETRSGRPGPAIRACRDALAVEPERVETLTLLANLLWEEPDRGAKKESLALLDRAAALRTDSHALLRLSAGRWAEYGDASKAQERLGRYLARATAREREEAEPLRQALSRRIRGVPEVSPTAVPEPEEPTSAAVDRWRKAQVYAIRGDDASLIAALSLLAEAEKSDPGFARAPELAGAIYERRSEWRQAEDALNRAIHADPSRATTYESLARILDRDPGRADEASRAWSRAERAGSTEALFHLAQSAERAGSGTEALRLYRRYHEEAPAGLHAADAASAVLRLDRRRSEWIFAAVSAIGLLLSAGAFALYRVRTGSTFAEWLSRNPGRAPEARRIIGRLRHETLKHGGMLLSAAANRLENGDDGTRRTTAALLVARLYGEAGSRGLVAEAEGSIAALEELALADGTRLNLAHRDPVFCYLVRGVHALRRVRRSILPLASSGRSPERRIRRSARLLRGSARCFQLASGSEIERSLDRASALPIRLDALRALLSRVAIESDSAAPALEITGEPATSESLPAVRISPSDWETMWRNLFANALAAGKLAISVVERRDAITGEGHLRIVLFDDLPGTLMLEEIRRRPSDRGLGVVVAILRRNDGSIDVVATPAPGFTKGIAIDLPIVERPQ